MLSNADKFILELSHGNPIRMTKYLASQCDHTSAAESKFSHIIIQQKVLRVLRILRPVKD